MSVVKSAWVVTVVSLASIASGVVAQPQRGMSLLGNLRRADDRFKDVAVALSEGYAPIPSASGKGVHLQAVKYEPGAGRYFYELRVWAWKQNPRGAFANTDPNVTSDHTH